MANDDKAMWVYTTHDGYMVKAVGHDLCVVLTPPEMFGWLDAFAKGADYPNMGGQREEEKIP